ncbi:S8 family serine peptidase [Nonomuraea candida]|uniref:S8 family serine peptidase n=1 Tax=Nonomuraea candida TaxID=359159 RepID=UPI0005BAC107|nr:S8 family serine peptidase [Nonomuraea candida]
MTLITGDRVLVTGRSHWVEPGPGREVSFTSRVRDGHLHVIPSDALPLIAQGALDPRLFDVTQLLEWHYGDADRPDIPVISQAEQGQPPAPADAVGVRAMAGLGMSAARVPKAGATRAWKELTGGGARALAAGRTKLWLDGRRSYALDESVRQIGAPQAWQQGLTGAGVTVAVLDSGYDAGHPGLKDAVAHERNFSEEPDMHDNHGHGTHVASIVAGRDEKYRGVAPEARLAIGKVGGMRGITESAALAGMEWAAVELGAKAVNMSFGAPDGPEVDPLEQAVETLSERTGTLFVVAAGNEGRSGTVGSPGSADAALTVGAVDKKGALAHFSSRGPRAHDHAIKPDVTAPGVDIMAAEAGTGAYTTMSGTSMAAPHVVGAAAILAQRHPGWTGSRLKAALIGSAIPAEGATPYQQGAGLIDLPRTLAQPVVARQSSVWAVFPWGGDGEPVATRTITYENTGDTPVTLALSAEGEVLKPAADRLDVPAGGEASVTLTIDARGRTPGDYPGMITATSGGQAIRTPAGAYVEPESYDVTVTTIGRQGRPVAPMASEVYDAKTGESRFVPFIGATAKLRLPEGEWHLHVSIRERNGAESSETTAVQPLTVDGADRELTVDARQGRPTAVSIDDPDAAIRPVSQYGLVHGAWYVWGFQGGIDVNGELFVIPADVPGLSYTLGTTWTSRAAGRHPYVYNLAMHHTGGLPANPVYHARRRDLAEITTTYRATGTQPTGRPLIGLVFHDLPGTSLWPVLDEIALPGTLVQYRTPGLTFESGLKTGPALLMGEAKVARRGHTTEVWNAAVTGPSFSLPAGSRTGDRLTFSGAGLFADGARGRSGSDGAATGTATLALNGKPLATAQLAGCMLPDLARTCELRADVPAGPGDYTLTASAARQSELSTKVHSEWTFRSASAPKARPLPLMAVRFAPQGLDDHNRARPGTVTRVPLWIEHNPGSAPKPALRSVRLELSYDDGTTWRRVPVTRAGESDGLARIPNPPSTGYVSLRATATDSAGAEVKQTILRTYAVK